MRIPTATGRSKVVPSFFMSAGARLTVIFLAGRLYPVFFIAARTLSLLSFTALSGKPTVENEGRPLEISTSTSTSRASMPSVVAVSTLESID